LTRYFLDDKDFASDVVNDQIYPVWTYTYLPLLFVSAPLAELIGYRQVIIIGTMCRVGTRVLLLVGTGTAAMQVMEALYAGGSVAEIVLSAYVFRVVSPSAYEAGIGATQAAYFASHVLSGVLGDLMTQAMDGQLEPTFWVSLATVSAAAILAVACLPRSHSHVPQESPPSSLETAKPSFVSRVSTSLHEVLLCVADARFASLCVLWCCGNCAWLFIYGWETSIYDIWVPGGKSDWNGTVLGTGLVLAGAAAALIALRPVQSMVLRRPLALAACSGTLAALSAVLTAWVPWPGALACLFAYMFCWQLTNAVFLASCAHRVDAVVAADSIASDCGEDEFLGRAAGSDDSDALFDPIDTATPLVGLLPRETAPAAVAVSDAEAPARAKPDSPYSLLLLLLNGASLALQTALQAWWLSALQIGVPQLFAWSSYTAIAGLVLAGVVIAGGSLLSPPRRAW
jgi:hypothetical protein